MDRDQLREEIAGRLGKLEESIRAAYGDGTPLDESRLKESSRDAVAEINSARAQAGLAELDRGALGKKLFDYQQVVRNTEEDAKQDLKTRGWAYRMGRNGVVKGLALTAAAAAALYVGFEVAYPLYQIHGRGVRPFSEWFSDPIETFEYVRARWPETPLTGVLRNTDFGEYSGSPWITHGVIPGVVAAGSAIFGGLALRARKMKRKLDDYRERSLIGLRNSVASEIADENIQ